MLTRLLAFLVIVAVTACGSTPTRARRPGEEYLAKIEIEGNDVISDEALIRGLSLGRTAKAERSIDEYQLSLDLTRIEGAYQRRGYFGVVVEPRIERKGDAATLIFKITEGPRATAVVDISGLPPEVPLEEARALVTLENGAPFDYIPFDTAKAPLLALVENAGYAHAQLSATVLANRVAHKAILRYSFELGPKVTFGAIEIVGTTGNLAEAIKRRAALQPGDTYSTNAVTQTQLAIYSIGRFTSVRVDVDRANLATVVPVKITVSEAKRNEFRFGLGAGLDTLTYQARTRISYSHAGWPTPLTKLGVELRPALFVLRDNCSWYDVLGKCEILPRVRALGTAEQQDIFTRGLNGDLEGGYDYLAIEAYTMQGPRVRLGFDVPFSFNRLHARAGWQLAGYWFSDRDPALSEDKALEIRVDTRDGAAIQRVGAFTQTFSIDYRDNPVSPRLGAYAEFRLAEGTTFAGGGFDYVQLTPDLRGYAPLGPFVLAARARLGVIKGDVPPTERYYAGGASSQRGFAERRLSPEVRADGESVVIGGAASFETGIEARASLPWITDLGAVVFLDGGDVTERQEDLKLDNLHWAIGFGLRYGLPVGPLRLELGYRLNRYGATEPSPGQRLNFILSVGEAF